MKKIIGGRVYDTDTSMALGKWQNTDDVCNFQHYREALYRKRTGEFFLHGEGGPMTKYAVAVGDNSWRGGEKIIPLTVKAAREWVEEHLTADEYEEIFGLPGEDAEPVMISAMIDAQLMAKLRAKAAEDGISVTACLQKILSEAL